MVWGIIQFSNEVGRHLTTCSIMDLERRNRIIVLGEIASTYDMMGSSRKTQSPEEMTTILR